MKQSIVKTELEKLIAKYERQLNKLGEQYDRAENSPYVQSRVAYELSKTHSKLSALRELLIAINSKGGL